jgi:hypothetical protein
VLLAALDVRRPTRDVDFQGQQLSNDVEQILAMVRTIANTPVDDGLVLDADAATAETIRDQDEYSGVRVTLTGQLAAAHLTFHVDINVGDPIWPAPQTVTLPRLLDGSIRVAQSQRRWAIWLRKQRLADRFPNDFGLILNAIGGFADPILLGEAAGRTWDAARLVWVQAPQLTN